MKATDPIAVLHDTPGPTKDEANPSSLGNVETVLEIVTQFSKEVIDRFGGGEGGADLLRWLEPECDAMNSLFLGWGRPLPPGKESFVRSNWNVPERCGAAVARGLQIAEVELRHAVRLAFMMLADWVTDILLANAENEDVESWMWQVAGFNERVAYALLGLPYEE